jgi:Zn-dependent M28 family amino/carboxypeptidase
MISLLLTALFLQAGSKDVSIPPSILEITEQSIQADVNHLADDSYYGRYWLSPFGRKAAVWIRDEMIKAGIEPGLPDDKWFQELSKKDASPNVIGIVRGTNSEAGYVIVGAHYDHLPPRRKGEDKIFNGADDNASGTAAILAIGKAMVALKDRLQSSVILIAFTGEEAGLKGSRHFVDNSPIDLKKVRGLFNLDMISRGERNTIFIDGAKGAPALIEALKKANEAIGLTLRVDEHPDWLSRSDQWPFIKQGVPAVLFSVEDHEDYHQVSDHADRIMADLAQNVARLTALATLDLAGGEGVPSSGAEAPTAEDGSDHTPPTEGTP